MSVTPPVVSTWAAESAVVGADASVGWDGDAGMSASIDEEADSGEGAIAIVGAAAGLTVADCTSMKKLNSAAGVWGKDAGRACWPTHEIATC